MTSTSFQRIAGMSRARSAALAVVPAVMLAVLPGPAAAVAAPHSPSQQASQPASHPASRPAGKAPAKPSPKPLPKQQPKAATAPAPVSLADWCKAISQKVPALQPAQCLASGVLPGEGRSVRGTPIWSRDVLPVKGPTRLRVLVLGGIHGDEMASVNLVFDWLAKSVRTREEPIHWRMVPLINPDGLLRQPATRVNARGVDLNRNFPTVDWTDRAHSYWASRTGKDPRRYPGPQAVSEPETRWVLQQIESFKPHLIVSVHAPYGVLDFDGPPPAPDKLGNLHLDQVGVFPGSLGNYAGISRQLPVVTLELKNAKAVPPRDVAAMWGDLLGWIDRRLINVAQAPKP